MLRNRPELRIASAGLTALWLLGGCGTLTVPQEKRLGEEFSREKLVEKTLAVYEEVLAERRPSSS